MRDCVCDSGFDIPGMFHANATNSHRLGHSRKIGILQFGARTKESRCSLLQFNEAQRAIIEDHDLHRESELYKAEKITHQHGETSIARERDDLPIWKCLLRPDGLRHRICHGSMPERTEQSPLSVYFEIARRPNRRKPYIASEDGILGRELAYRSGHVLRMNGRIRELSFGQIIQIAPCPFVMRNRLSQEEIVFLGLKLWEQECQSGGDVAHNPEAEAGPPAKIFRPNIHLDNLRIGGLRKELLVRKIGSQHEQQIAIAHGMITGRHADEAGEPDVVRIIALQILLSFERAYHRRFEFFRKLQHLLLCARASRAAQKSDAAVRLQEIGASDSEGTIAGLLNSRSDGMGLSFTAGCSAISPGITTTETPRFAMASRIAIFKTRGI